MRSTLSLRLILTGAMLALPSSGHCAATVAHPGGPAVAEAASARDGSHDFDFEYGRWRMPNHRLRKRLANAHEWADFVTCDEGSPLPGGLGDVDYLKAAFWNDFVGMTIRTYDPKTGLWRIYWVDNRFSHGVIQPPVTGRFNGNVGIFEGPDTFDGKPIIVRFTWRVYPEGYRPVAKWEQAPNPEGLPVVATWNQAFSTDGGRTWETNWYNELIRDDHCSPTP